MRYFLIAGEASGDLHGSNLIKALKQEDAKAEFVGWGGDLMQEQGMQVLKHYRELAFMGFLVVLQNLRTILGNEKLCKKQIQEFGPDVVIFIDYPGFNLRIAKWAKNFGLKTYYYISPKVWAWKQSRAKKIKQYIDEMFVIFPFEIDFYKTYNYPVNFVGHPLLDAIENFTAQSITEEEFKKQNNLDSRPIIAMLPGSRKHEISDMLPIMLQTAKKYKNYQFVIAGAPAQEIAFYKSFAPYGEINLVTGKTYELLQHSKAGLITSGTATLETALFNVPQIVCYKGAYISYQVAKRLIKVKYISLVNLILDRPVLKEFIQNDLSVENLTIELNQILLNTEYHTQMLNEYEALKLALGKAGASKRAAKLMVEKLQKVK